MTRALVIILCLTLATPSNGRRVITKASTVVETESTNFGPSCNEVIPGAQRRNSWLTESLKCKCPKGTVLADKPNSESKCPSNLVGGRYFPTNLGSDGSACSCAPPEAPQRPVRDEEEEFFQQNPSSATKPDPVLPTTQPAVESENDADEVDEEEEGVQPSTTSSTTSSPLPSTTSSTTSSPLPSTTSSAATRKLQGEQVVDAVKIMIPDADSKLTLNGKIFKCCRHSQTGETILQDMSQDLPKARMVCMKREGCGCMFGDHFHSYDFHRYGSQPACDVKLSYLSQATGASVEDLGS